MDFPSSPINGQQTTDGRYYFDSSVGTSGAWRSAPLPVGGLPAGSIMAWGTNTPPANWLIADGSAVSRSTYSSLFAVIGTQYGAGNGTTTFNLPDLRGRVPVGQDAAALRISAFNLLAQSSGSATHTLTIPEMPSHTHVQNEHSHQYYINIQHGDGTAVPSESLTSGLTAGGRRRYVDGTQNSIATNQNTGGGQAHNNLQPYLVVNYIIKATAGWTAGDSELATRLGELELTRPLSENYVLNGGMEISQRGIGTTPIRRTATEYGLDRWLSWQFQAGRFSRQVVTGTGPTSRLAMRVGSSTTALDAGTRMRVGQKIESHNTYPLRGKKVTLSFYIRFSNATFTSSTATPFLDFVSELGYYTSSTDSNFGASTSDSSTLMTLTNGSLPTSWTRYTVTGTVPTNANNVHVGFTFLGLGSTAANDALWYELTDVQLEEGSQPTAFRRNGTSLEAELSACRRYFQWYDSIVATSFDAWKFANIPDSGILRTVPTVSVADISRPAGGASLGSNVAMTLLSKNSIYTGSGGALTAGTWISFNNVSVSAEL
jgi:microcystin-dependent protein